VRVLIFADLHANWEALQALQAESEPTPFSGAVGGLTRAWSPDRQNVTHVRGTTTPRVTREATGLPDDYRLVRDLVRPARGMHPTRTGWHGCQGQTLDRPARV
jgi:hypothetical protein